MSNTSGTVASNKFWAVLAGGFFAVWFIVGLGWGLIWLCAAASYGLFQWRAWAGVVFAAMAAAVFATPPLFDQTVLDEQVATIEAQEVSIPPIDVTGRTIPFVVGTRYLPWDCSNSCRAVAEYGTADAVYFGHDRSLDLRFGNGPIDLIGREIHSFPAPIAPGLPSETRSTPTVLPGTVDCIVVENPSSTSSTSSTSSALATLVPDVPIYGGIYATNSLWVEYIMFEGGDLSVFDPTSQTPLVTRFDYTRHSHTFPSLPLLALGDIDFTHQHNPDLSWRVNANTREVAQSCAGRTSAPIIAPARLYWSKPRWL